MSQALSPSDSPTKGPSPAERLASIDERQQRLLCELDGLNQRIEAAIMMFGGTAQAVEAAA